MINSLLYRAYRFSLRRDNRQLQGCERFLAMRLACAITLTTPYDRVVAAAEESFDPCVIILAEHFAEELLRISLAAVVEWLLYKGFGAHYATAAVNGIMERLRNPRLSLLLLRKMLDHSAICEHRSEGGVDEARIPNIVKWCRLEAIRRARAMRDSHHHRSNTDVNLKCERQSWRLHGCR